MSAPVNGPDAALLSALTTEHFTLQAARSATILESSSRATLFLGAVTGMVLALAFVGQVSRTGPTFVLFALSLLPTALLIGVFTYARLLQSSIEDLTYARAINRIRGYYRTLDPVAERYLLMSPAEQLPGILANVGMHRHRLHLLGHTATTVAVVDAALAGATAGLAVSLLGGVTAPVAGVAGGLAALTTLGLLLAHQSKSWNRVAEAAA